MVAPVAAQETEPSRPRAKRGRGRFGLICFALAALLGLADGSRAQPTAPEYELKAAFLLHFAQFVEWPQGKARDSICLGVLGRDPFGSVLDQMAGGEAIRGRKLVIRRSAHIEGLKGCEFIFIPRSEKAETAELLALMADRPILTVGEINGFAEMGGVINFFLDGRKLRFEINPDAARRSGLKLSSQLLSLGRLVRDESRSEN